MIPKDVSCIPSHKGKWRVFLSIFDVHWEGSTPYRGVGHACLSVRVVILTRAMVPVLVWLLWPHSCFPDSRQRSTRKVLSISDSQRDRKSQVGPPFLPALGTSWATEPQATTNLESRWAGAHRDSASTASSLNELESILSILENSFSVELSLAPLPSISLVYSGLCFVFKHENNGLGTIQLSGPHLHHVLQACRKWQ